MKKIYISPSTQESNRGVTPFGTEEVEMNKIADKLMPLLLNDGRYEIRRNTPYMDPYQCAADSNTFGANIHIAIHSNAGGGEGTEVLAYASGSNSERLAKCLYAHISPLSPSTDRGVKFNPKLIEVGDTVKATSCLIELAFHDNAKDAKWLVDNQELIAVALYKGICDYFGYEYRYLVIEPIQTPTSPLPTPTDKDIYLSVRVLESLHKQAIVDINKLGFAAKRMELA